MKKIYGSEHYSLVNLEFIKKSFLRYFSTFGRVVSSTKSIFKKNCVPTLHVSKPSKFVGNSCIYFFWLIKAQLIKNDIFLLTKIPFVCEAGIASYLKKRWSTLRQKSWVSPGTPVLPTGRVDRVVTYGYKNVTNFWKPFYLDLLSLLVLFISCMFLSHMFFFVIVKQLVICWVNLCKTLKIYHFELFHGYNIFWSINIYFSRKDPSFLGLCSFTCVIVLSAMFCFLLLLF